MGLTYLFDSNVLIDYTGKKFTGTAEIKLDEIANDTFYYSIISRIEVLSFNGEDTTLKNLEDFLNVGMQYYVTDEIAKQTFLIRRFLPKLKTPDAIIAATAIVHNHILLSRNLADFKNIPGLTVIDPHTF